MTFWKKYGWKIIIVLVVVLIIIYIIFIVDSGFISTGNSLNREDWLGFIAGYLSFAGSVFLGAVALWQNEKANEVNKKLEQLQELQLGVNKGILLPLENDNSYIYYKGQYNLLEVEEQKLQVPLQNRGTDFIHDCRIVEMKINDKAVILKEKPLISIEKEDIIIYDFDISSIDMVSNPKINIYLELEMKNSCRVKYIEKFTASFEKYLESRYEYFSYNFNIEENIKA